MPRQTLTAAEAARALGISVDTLRRWDRAGKFRVERDSANRRVVAASRGGAAARPRRRARRSRRATAFAASSARSRSTACSRRIEIDVTEPSRVVAIVTRESAEELGLRAGMSAAGVVKSTSVMVER